MSVTIRVYGQPAPQGSKRHVGGGRMIEASKKVGPWRAAVEEAVASLFFEPFSGPVRVEMVFFLKRPKTVTRLMPTVPPDLDKLVRGLFDALTIANVWVDDSLAVEMCAEKVYCDSVDDEGATILIEEIAQN